MPPFCFANVASVIGNPRRFNLARIADPLGYAGLLKPFMSFFACYMLGQRFAQVT